MIVFIGLILILLILILVIMNNTKASAKDFFLHLGAIVALYTVAISFLNLIFRIINEAFPEVGRNYYAWGGGSEISLPVATLIIIFPLFLILSRFVNKIYSENPAKKELGIRKWLVYITLFVAGIILAGDLVTVLYKFLDGQDLTAAFLLKALSVLLVAGCVFGFYLQDIRDRVPQGKKKMWALVVGIVILVAIILGFSVLGSPNVQRALRLDNQKISDLGSLQQQVISYWQMNGMIPESSSVLMNYCAQNYCLPEGDTADYEYRKTGILTFKLCATFNMEKWTNLSGPAAVPIYGKGDVIQNYNWNHGAGRQCFDRVIDPTIYPTQVRG